MPRIEFGVYIVTWVPFSNYHAAYRTVDSINAIANA